MLKTCNSDTYLQGSFQLIRHIFSNRFGTRGFLETWTAPDKPFVFFPSFSKTSPVNLGLTFLLESGENNRFSFVDEPFLKCAMHGVRSIIDLKHS